MTCFNSDGKYIVAANRTVDVFEFGFNTSGKRLIIATIEDKETIYVKRKHLKMFNEMLRTHMDTFCNELYKDFTDGFYLNKAEHGQTCIGFEYDGPVYAIRESSWPNRDYRIYGFDDFDYIDINKSDLFLLINAVDKIIETEHL